MPRAALRACSATLALQTLLFVSPVLAAGAQDNARGLLAAAEEGAGVPVPGWAGCVLAVLRRYPALVSAVWCESASSCLPDATLRSASGTTTSWTLASAPAGAPAPSSRRRRTFHVLVHDDAGAGGRRAWPEVRGRRIHVWLGARAPGLAYLGALWRRAGLADVLLLLPGALPRDPVRLYSVYPYARAARCNSDAAVPVDEWVPDDGRGHGHGGAFRYGRDLFPRKLDDLRGCNLTVFVRQDSPFMMLSEDPHTGEAVLGGPLSHVLRAVQQHLNFRAVLLTPIVNESTCDSRLTTYMRHADLGFTMSVHGVYADSVRYDDSRMVVCLAWCVPVVAVRAFALLETLSPAAWLGVALACLVAGVALAGLQRDGVDSLGGVWGAYGLVCGPLLQQPVRLGRRVNSGALRALVAHWGLAALVLVAVLEGSVKSASVTLRTQPLVRDMHDLARGAGARLTLLGSVGVVEMLRRAHAGSSATSDEELGLLAELAERVRVCDTQLEAALSRAAEDGDAAVLSFDFRCTTYNQARGEMRLHRLGEYCMRPSPLHLFSAPLWSPYMDRVSEVRIRLGEAGLVTNRLRHLTGHGTGLGRAHGLGHVAMAQWRNTRVEDVVPHLLVLAVGLALASAVLAVELAHGHGCARALASARALARSRCAWVWALVVTTARAASVTLLLRRRRHCREGIHRLEEEFTSGSIEDSALRSTDQADM